MITAQNTPALINPNLLGSIYQAPGIPALNLTQIDKFDPAREFTDSNGGTWKLVKDARSGMSEIPDPQTITITDYWNHELPGAGGKIFIYVVEGIRPPKTTRETPCRILYSWFSTTNNPGFTPQMIRPQEWLIANVYAAALTDARTSKLDALTRGATPQRMPQTPAETEAPAPLIKMEDIAPDEPAPAATPRRDDQNNQGERGKNNRR